MLASLHDLVVLACLPAAVAFSSVSTLYRLHLQCLGNTWRMLRGRYTRSRKNEKAVRPQGEVMGGTFNTRPSSPLQAPRMEALLGKPKGDQVRGEAQTVL
jgi:hypothetical protein